MRSLAAMTMAVGMSAVPASSANATAPGGPPPCDPPSSGIPEIPCDSLSFHAQESLLNPDGILSLGGAEDAHSVSDYDSVMGVVAWSQPQIGLSCADGPTCGNDDLLPLPTPHQNNTPTLDYIPACGPRDSGVCGGTPWPDLQWWNFGVDMTASRGSPCQWTDCAPGYECVYTSTTPLCVPRGGQIVPAPRGANPISNPCLWTDCAPEYACVLVHTSDPLMPVQPLCVPKWQR